MTGLDINCLLLHALSASANVGWTSRDKFSELNKHILLTRGELWLYNDSLSMINAQESRGMTDDSSFHVYCKSLSVYF